MRSHGRRLQLGALPVVEGVFIALRARGKREWARGSTCLPDGVRKMTFARVLALLLMSTHAAAGQAANPLAVGGDIRLWAPFYGLEGVRGSLVAWAADSVVVRVEEGTVAGQPPGATTTTVPTAAVVRLDALGGRSRAQGALTGAILFGVAGGVIGAVGTDCDPDDYGLNGDLECAFQPMIRGMVGIVAGGAVGGLVGSLFPKDVWVRQELPLSPTVGR